MSAGFGRIFSTVPLLPGGKVIDDLPTCSTIDFTRTKPEPNSTAVAVCFVLFEGTGVHVAEVVFIGFGMVSALVFLRLLFGSES